MADLATDFYSQLREFSEKVFQKKGISEKETPWTYGKFKDGRPHGVILHYTAGSDPLKALRWFMMKSHGSKASAHLIVARDWPEDMKVLAEGLPLVQALPTMVIQCMPPSHTTWHAGWTNKTHYGIEIVNAGEVRLDEDEGGWLTWTGNWTGKYEPKGVPVDMAGKFWEPYGEDQLVTVIEVLRWFRKWIHDLDRSQVLGHEQVQKNKLDPGPLFPIRDIRKSIYEDLDPRIYRWFEHFSKDPRYGEFDRDAQVLEWCQAEFPDEGQVPAYKAWAEFLTQLQVSLLKVGTPFAPLGKLALGVLGYHVSDVTTDKMLSGDEMAVKIFQRMAKLNPDGDPGPSTREAIVKRIKDRGFTENRVI